VGTEFPLRLDYLTTESYYDARIHEHKKNVIKYVSQLTEWEIGADVIDAIERHTKWRHTLVQIYEGIDGNHQGSTQWLLNRNGLCAIKWQI